MADPVLVFDLDGTLIHSAPEIHGVARDVLAQEGLPELSYELITSFVGNGLPTLVSRILVQLGLPGTGEQHHRMVEHFESIYQQRFDLTSLYPGVMSMLHDLSGRHRLAICTNKPQAPTRAVLAHFGLTDFFSVVIGGDTLPRRKPDPLPLHQAIRDSGGGDAIFVGDSEVDADTARNAQIPFALFTGGYRKTAVEDLGAKWIFDHHDEFRP
ncbi:phosphoglycolate phosphatase [Fuscibacter oryzae]|uniref:phosphoglycolate phosphatase n=1 Tax=Fuscibacter oryzae TaxID=2803939 RepID=A0A8J7MNI9_9RHOB|nr:phosphoglycolate phosphatase [Fuscibacter oryzae]MBL4927507.1 phosphoglycolate phosphatase [Fuscibacter oryzae]